MLIALDTEVGSVDLYLSANVYLVTICYEDGRQRFWEFDVAPLTRKAVIPKNDIVEIRQAVADATEIVGQNLKYDSTALRLSGIIPEWPWHKCQDCLIAGHILASNQRHDLTSMVLTYLNHDIEPLELEMKSVVNECRRICRRDFPDWRIAEKGLPEMPSAKSGSKKDERGVESESPWKFDCWLPRRLARTLKLLREHPWWTVTSKYANGDSGWTLALWKVMRKLLEKKGFWELYKERMNLPRLAEDLERRGVTLSKSRLVRHRERYQKESAEMGAKCLTIAKFGFDYDLELPKGATPNNSLRTFCLDVMKLPPVYKKKSKTNAPTLGKEAMEEWLYTLPDGEEREFLEALAHKRRRDTSIAYLTGYERFWQPIGGDFYVLHGSFNCVGTDTTRWASSSPNMQNISSKQAEDGDDSEENASVRYVFGPAPGREWWSMDANNIELRIPAYVSGEEAFIALFEKADEPPYFGSNHLLIAHVLHEDEFNKCLNDDGVVDGRVFKKRHPAKYKRVKNGDFAVQYQAGDDTADAAYGINGARAIIKARFAKQDALNDKYVRLAKTYGFVSTLPSKTVGRGYPLLAGRGESGYIRPTTPLNYVIQGSAGDWLNRAMIRCSKQLSEWTEKEGRDYYMTLTVHDQLVFDMCAGIGPEPWRTNLEKARILRGLMEMGGAQDLGIPTPVSIEYHAVSWDQGVTIS